MQSSLPLCKDIFISLMAPQWSHLCNSVSGGPEKPMFSSGGPICQQILFLCPSRRPAYLTTKKVRPLYDGMMEREGLIRTGGAPPWWREGLKFTIEAPPQWRDGLITLNDIERVINHRWSTPMGWRFNDRAGDHRLEKEKWRRTTLSFKSHCEF